jgi:hypothetical protein
MAEAFEPFPVLGRAPLIGSVGRCGSWRVGGRGEADADRRRPDLFYLLVGKRGERRGPGVLSLK